MAGDSSLFLPGVVCGVAGVFTPPSPCSSRLEVAVTLVVLVVLALVDAGYTAGGDDDGESEGDGDRGTGVDFTRSRGWRVRSVRKQSWFRRSSTWCRSSGLSLIEF